MRSSIVAPALIACIAEGRAPDARELQGVADRIWQDMNGRRPAFAWGALSSDEAEHRLVLRAAEAALIGGPIRPGRR